MQDEGKFWDDPESPWSAGMRRHTRRFIWMLIGMVIAEAFIGITMYTLLFGMDGRGVSSDSISILLYIIVPVSMVYPPIMIYRQFARHRKLVHLIPESKGLLCPICHITMSAVEEDTLKCSRCSRAETNEVIESYWVQYSLDATALTTSFLKYKSQGKSGLGRFRTDFQRRMIENPIFLAGYMIGIFVIGGMVFGYMNSQSMLGSIFEFSHMMFIMGGFAFLGIGYAKRKGMTMHCVACEYQQAPSGEPSERCPECGQDLRVAGAIVKGQKIRTRQHIAIGIAMMSVGVLLIFNPFMAAWKYKTFPTNSLIFDAVNIWYRNEVWSELATRPLTQDQEYTLAEGLLDLRLREGHIADGGEIWLLKQFNAGVLPGELADRLFLECFEFDLSAPTQTVVGQKVDISLHSEYRHNSAPGFPDSWIYIGDWAVNDRAITDSHVEEAIGRWRLDDFDLDLTLTPDHVGPIRITRDLYLVFSATSLRGSITWQEDGTPLIPPGVTWQRKITLQQEIEITD